MPPDSLLSTHPPRPTLIPGFPLLFQDTDSACLFSQSTALVLRVLSLTLPVYYPCLYSRPSPTSLQSQNPFQHLMTDQPVLDPNTPHWVIDGSSQNPTLCGRICRHPGKPSSQPTRHRYLTPHLCHLHTTSQQAELVALTKALTLAKHLRVSIYTDSKYAYNSHSNILIRRKEGSTPRRDPPLLILT